MANFYERACARLAAAGYEHYEISNWALPGFESKHNLKYWRREPYFGFGAGAHSFNGTQRWANAHDPGSYAGTIAQGRFCVEQLETVTPEQSLEEELFLGLRKNTARVCVLASRNCARKACSKCMARRCGSPRTG
jgi:oxygen-independent coproporphyrinogen-3 oxidase